MAEVPEHLLRRSRERRKALGLPVEGEEADAPAEAARAADAGGAEAAPAEEAAPVAASADAGETITESAGGVPAHLLERSRKRKAALAGGGGGDAPAAGGGGTATATLPRTAAATAPAPSGTGPGGHTQRLLTVVKSGSIQQTRADAQDKVHVWPHLLVIEFAAIAVVHRVPHDLLRAREGAAARPRRRQPDAEPVEGTVVLPRVAGAAHDVHADGRGRDHPRHRARPAHGRAVRRQEPVAQADRPEVRDLRSSRSS